MNYLCYQFIAGEMSNNLFGQNCRVISSVMHEHPAGAIPGHIKSNQIPNSSEKDAWDINKIKF